jgi:glycerol uptake facilitator-like aquaporin
VARALSDTFSGIRPADVPAFIVAQLLGASSATVLFAWFADELHVSRWNGRTIRDPADVR